MAQTLMGFGFGVDHGCGPIPSALGNLSSIRTLALDNNNLEGGIPPELGQLFNLEVVDSSCNNLSGVVPPSLYNISSIKTFVQTLNRLHGSLPTDMGLTLPNLRTFLFGGNKFSGPFPPSIANATGLVQFEIASNYITGPVPMNLGSLQDLERLNLGANKLGTNKSNELSFLDSLVNCTHLSELIIGINGFGGVLPDSLVNLSTELTFLRLDSNYILGSMPLDIRNLVNLEYLSLGNNMFSGNIPESIGNLFKLTEVYLYGNYISGKLPSSIGNISELSILALEANMLEGRIPLSLGNCTKLLALDLQYNQLIGMIPEQIVGLSSLSQALYLNQNRLTGPLPLQVGNLKNLGSLSISGNRLTGAITSALGDCQVLEFLDMHDNLFEGTIPSSLEQLKGIRVLDLSRNMLSGQIPKFLSELPLVEFLNLSYNELDGEVPTEGVFKNVSAFSIVGNMKLCGGNQALQLPACPGNVTADKKRNHFPRTILPLATTLPVILLLACVLGIIYRLVKAKQQTNPASLRQDEHPKLSYAELHKATDGFSSTNLIGEGSYGIVYKGILAANDQIVAVKRDGFTNTKENMNCNVFGIEANTASLFQLGLQCSAESPKERMDVKDVTLELRKIRNEYVGAAGRKSQQGVTSEH
ncbi:hypothetical protein RJ639_004885 [Escallonia herrerae]|uniref:non-specific serine/threonine protein kinase n=1 Tax=Escallonia herrerae TaxID=1293975 RepID=A0AA89B2D8_9ASTE|nr:hypothetical protein RJ639_004885 [Escallonia herrerae]